MSSAIVPGTRVRVRIRRNQPCALHAMGGEAVVKGEATGTVDRIDERSGGHGVVVVFDLFCPTIGTRWVDSFTVDELEPIPKPL